MGKAADEGGLMFRVLNHTKGPAVHVSSPRKCGGDFGRAFEHRWTAASTAQRCSGQSPKRTLLKRGRSSPHRRGLYVYEGSAEDLVLNSDRTRLEGLVTGDGCKIECKAVVITTGTFLRGMIHIGEAEGPPSFAHSLGKETTPAGRRGDPPSVALAKFARS